MCGVFASCALLKVVLVLTACVCAQGIYCVHFSRLAVLEGGGAARFAGSLLL